MIKHIPIFIKLIILIFLLNVIIVQAYNSFSMVKDHSESMVSDGASRGEKLFKTNCSGCHLNGKNLIKPDKPIIGSLKLKSKESFKVFISSPPPPMPNFKNIALKDDHFNALYNYVVSLMGN